MMERRSKSGKASRKQAPALRKKSPRRSNKKGSSNKSVRFQQADENEHGASTKNGATSGGGARGLRQMSVKICEKVHKSGKVSCNEVADELLHMIRLEEQQQKGGGSGGKLCDDKNIRRRLYDALNVLDAVDVLKKDSKDITWKGVPSGQEQQTQRLMSERHVREKQVKEKQEAMREHVIQQVAYRNLVHYNKGRQQSLFRHWEQDDKLPLPFVMLNAHPSATIHCESSQDFTDVMIDANTPFAVHDENAILAQLGLNQIRMEDLKQLITQDMLNYCQKHGLLLGILSGKRPACANDDDYYVQPMAKRLKTAQYYCK